MKRKTFDENEDLKTVAVILATFAGGLAFALAWVW